MTASTQPQTTSRVDCLCGCGQPTSPKANYRPGHDASHVSILLAELFNEIQDGRGVSESMIKASARQLPSEALRVKFTRAADKLVTAKPKKARATKKGFLGEYEEGEMKVGRWTYPTRMPINTATGEYFPMERERNTKRDGSGEWIPAPVENV